MKNYTLAVLKADKNNISVNTVRVHVKNAMDKIREKVGSRVGILLFFLF